VPGIVGLCDFRRDNEELNRIWDGMSNSLCHETWYRIDRYTCAPIALGRVGLGLLNPKPQPIFSQDRALCIVMDGELFNYDSLKAQLRAEGCHFSIENDVEFLLHWYQARGIEGLGQLNGSFVLAIWDNRTQTLTLANDRYGLRPLYYAQRADCLLFGSEVKALLADPSLTKTIDPQAVADFFAFELLLGDKTFFSEIQVLPPASVLTFGRQTWAMNRYWDFTFCEEPMSVNEQATFIRLDELLQSAVKRHTNGDLTTGMFLSGGLDSRTLLGAAARQSLSVQTFTMGHESSYDRRFAQQISDTVGTEHYTLSLCPEAQAEVIKRGVWLTDGMMNCIHMSILNLLPLTRSSVDVVVDGIGGDGTLGGHYLCKSFFEAPNNKALTLALFDAFNTAFSPSMVSDYFTDHFSSQIKDLSLESMCEQVRLAPPERLVNKSEYVYMRNRQRRFISFGPTMTRSQLESRAPFYDNDLIEFIFSLPAEMRQNHNLHWHLLIRHYPELSAIPWTFTGLPINISTPTVQLFSRIWFRLQRELNRILLRASKGQLSLSNSRNLVDYASWWRSALKDWALGLILSPQALERGYVNPEALQSLVGEHMNGYRDHSIRLGILITFELWHRMFVD
jgi:asparagine synthase (glutamine-hydrolysing)